MRHELETDLRMLALAESEGLPSFRVWTTSAATVVVGRGGRIEAEVEMEACDRCRIPIVRRPSGGGAVLVGTGTVQYGFALPYALDPELRSIAGSKRFCNRVLIAGLARHGGLIADESGDLVLAGRKVAGVALKRKREAMLLHGTILADADLDLIAWVLKHPPREPDYRQGRSHAGFLANLGPVDVTDLARAVGESLGLLSQQRLGVLPATHELLELLRVRAVV